jgi:outer membrane lipoprotein-sorting protein
MTELGDLLELLHTGGVGDATVRATIVTWTHLERSSKAFQAMAEEQGSALFSAYGPVDTEVPEETTSTFRIWIAPPDRAREEHDDSIAVCRGRLWWRYSPDEGAVSNEEEPEVRTNVAEGFKHLLDPGSLLGVVTLEPAGRGEVNGREVVLATARARNPGDEEERWTRHELGFGADEWRLAVDAERGVLLRLESLRGGEPFSRSEIVELAIGEPIDDDVFVFVPPPGEELQPLDHHPVHHSLAPDELARLAGFAVFVPDRVADGWEVDLALHGGSERGGVAPTAFVNLRSEDGLWSATIAQTVGESDDGPFDALDQPTHWRTETRGGLELRLREPPESWATALVRTEIEETRIQITSNTLGVDRLADLAGRLVRAPADQPGWE